MKNLFQMFFLVLTLSCYCQTKNQKFVATDIDNFWNAYEKIISTNDTVKQYNFLKEFYTDKGT